ncbi:MULTISPECIES: phosphate regulon transcriptional regulator PhoB [unclassified Undibacterium]|uniref:phosphate regulon transcriptional regulator PhoB n=1 Tax=unclassified Undibacterium TaxID=2630295 RepID=UPI002AC8B78F|nr:MULTISPECIES: phosphate regulon transcriptional regulator PhoB [unclassified Undibacterium]MEB0139219.1 phosphate regulon transcriptional regulator PhoB [Undibacterium sp. CCC2.1]MEB0172206.1 phosphate regulon transcriptional regulator PhoB [Undibacterium sp. CCC1.1]MEB0175937.1 phosphate regulon transcriptional regulator PhoB [Undibacterium sp. CCC3.4]MEB0215203.1 phosphate regulon transcriptional regulator PhoB [Undibacterium sp. 5I2]WPX43506.1 phosphate regulon transcriptional regulator 
MAADTTILIVEDEPAIVELVSFTLRAAGWNTFAVNNTADAWDFVQRRTPQLILLDWMLPDQSGLRLLSKIRSDRQFNEIPVIMLTAKSMEEDKIAGLDHGADDYITKPFSPRELTARIKALLRRKSPEHAQTALQAGPVVLDPVSCTVKIDGLKVDIGHAEYKLLKFFMAHPERVFSRSQLLDKVWGDHVVIEERTVDVHVLRLRKVLKTAEGLIQTVRSVGYMLSEK